MRSSWISWGKAALKIPGKQFYFKLGYRVWLFDRISPFATFQPTWFLSKGFKGGNHNLLTKTVFSYNLHEWCPFDTKRPFWKTSKSCTVKFAYWCFLWTLILLYCSKQIVFFLLSYLEIKIISQIFHSVKFFDKWDK